MAEETRTSDRATWVEAIGLPHLCRILGLAIQPSKLGIALLAIILTVALGGVLDVLWKTGGGIGESAIDEFMGAHHSGQPYQEPTGDLGIFKVWREHEKRCVLGLLGSAVPGTSVAAGTSIGAYMESRSHGGLLGNLVGMGYGVWWLLRVHFFFFLFFGIGALLIWSWGGGAICRAAALQFARDEKLTLAESNRFAFKHLISGFALTPCIPIVGMVAVMILMVLGGAVLRIPVFGDVLAGTAFPLAIMGGFVIAILLIGLLVGGNLFWPAVAVEGQDAYDAFSRGLSYAFSKPWKTVIYAVIAFVYAGICWVLVNLFTYLALAVTRAVVTFGTSPFGWWLRGTEGDATSKMELLWPLSGPNGLYSWPDWSKLWGLELYSGFIIGVYVLLVIGLMWAFLASFYFSGSTVIYFLLRRDVDKTDIEDVQLEEGDEVAGAAELPKMSKAEAGAADPPVESEPSPQAEPEEEPPEDQPLSSSDDM